MVVIDKENYFLLQLNKDSLKSFANDFKKWKRKHCVIELSENLDILQEKNNILLKTAITQKESGLSFVIIQKGIDIDKVSEKINIVPSIQEAEDILEMEAIERDLGF